MALVDQLGFDPVDAGGLDQSWRQQPGSPCYITDSDVALLPEQTRPGEPAADAGALRHRQQPRQLHRSALARGVGFASAGAG